MVAARQAQGRPGIVETLNAGFQVINRSLWVLLVPFLVDLFLWRGPHLSVAPLGERLALEVEGLLARPELATLDPAQASQLADVAKTVREASAGFNLFVLLVVTIARAVLTFKIASVPSAAELRPTAVPVAWTIGDFGSLLVAAVALQVLGIVLTALYFGLIGQSVLGTRPRLAELGRVVGSAALRLAGLLVGLIAAVLLGLLPIAVLVGIASAVSAGVGQALLLLVVAGAQIAVVWLNIYLFFALDAIVLSGSGPVAAARQSIRGVARNFWPTLGLIGLSLVINLGMGQVWRWLLTVSEASPFGEITAYGVSLANAYVVSGLAAASMLFFWNRMRNTEATQPST